MNLDKKKSFQRSGNFPADEPFVVEEMSQLLKDWMPENQNSELIIVCIGTDRSTGDSLGPLTGTLTKQKNIKNFTVYGTLEYPVHAMNLEETLADIQENHSNPYIIAVDASLGNWKSVGSIIAAKGPVKPGAALKKPLPDVGDMHITGIVNKGGFMEFFVLQNTRLYLVMELAQKIANAFQRVDLLLGDHASRTERLAVNARKRAEAAAVRQQIIQKKLQHTNAYQNQEEKIN